MGRVELSSNDSFRCIQSADIDKDPLGLYLCPRQTNNRYFRSITDEVAQAITSCLLCIGKSDIEIVTASRISWLDQTIEHSVFFEACLVTHNNDNEYI